ncbi:hypothetical protein FSP39_025050 [Pinctada imbricata]|uniref:Cytochrome b5 heme-binding domain-containing protein n=1 Tax=Pinctada imbricata TaxID=66713 RepID=A0AA88XE60_PINIB|nr:hypothetical protein FSP39_025050 [Pinctada imbricata]
MGLSWKSLVLLSLLVGVVAILCTYAPGGKFSGVFHYLIDYLPRTLRSKLTDSSSTQSGNQNNVRLFTKAELQGYRGDDGGPIYMAILGQVFDVTNGRKHYGPGGSYHFFTGVDGTRGFITGDFTEAGLTENIDDFDLQQIKGIAEWVEFYQKQYKFIGKLIGHFYNPDGGSTDALEAFKVKLEQASKQQQLEQEDFKKYPPCNSENKPGVYRKLWCSKQSGGIKRDWAGVPREYFQPGQREPRCACVKNYGTPTEESFIPGPHDNVGDLNNPMFKVYTGCDANSDSCVFKE